MIFPLRGQRGVPPLAYRVFYTLQKFLERYISGIVIICCGMDNRRGLTKEKSSKPSQLRGSNLMANEEMRQALDAFKSAIGRALNAYTNN